MKPEDVKANPQITVVGAGRIRSKEETGFEKDVLEIEVDVGGEIKTWSLNNTSYLNIATAYGKNSDGWVGKQVSLKLANQMVNGEMKEVIYAEVPDKD